MRVDLDVLHDRGHRVLGLLLERAEDEAPALRVDTLQKKSGHGSELPLRDPQVLIEVGLVLHGRLGIEDLYPL